MPSLFPCFEFDHLQAASSLLSLGAKPPLSPITIETYEPNFSQAIASVIWSRHHGQATCSIFNCGVPNCPLCPAKESPKSFTTEIAEAEGQLTAQQTTSRHLPVVNWLTSPSSSTQTPRSDRDIVSPSSTTSDLPLPSRSQSSSPQVSSPIMADIPARTFPELSAKRRRLEIDNALLAKAPEKTELPHACRYCPKRFAQASNCASHMRTHTGLRPYKCPSCPKAFAQRTSLRTHLRTHTGDRPYLCEMCDSRFGDLSTLTKHRRTHTGEKPYRCSYEGCNRAFAQSGNLKRHYRTHILDAELARIGV